jgi:hypothetical protein
MELALMYFVLMNEGDFYLSKRRFRGLAAEEFFDRK